VLVEGVGGWRVPLGWDFEVRDFAIALGYPVLVVVPDKLGALNHALLTVESIVDAGLDVTAVILNGGGPWAVVPSNLEDLRRLLHVPVCVFPNLDLHNAKARRAAGAHLLDSGAFQER
jgi:dethiobiotin synthetase